MYIYLTNIKLGCEEGCFRLQYSVAQSWFWGTHYVDGAQAAAFAVQTGDKVKIMVLYNKVQLIRTG
jgi:hypothetical protein